VSLQIEQLYSVVDGVSHLQDISLQFDTDSFNILLGPARAGKTSLLRQIAGLDTPTSGRMMLHGEDITGCDVRKRDVAFVYQEFVNYPTLSVFENIASPLRVRSENKQTIDRKVGEIAELLAIGSVLGRHPPSLSGGQQQRVAIARALAKDAEVILLDEPLANLDYKLREDLRRELPRLFAGRGKIVVYAATDPNEAFLLDGNTIVLDKGTVKQVGSAATIFAAPDSLSAASIMSEFPINLLDANVEDSKCIVANTLSFPLPTHMRALSDGSYTLGFRAEQFSFAAATPMSVACDTKVTVTEITGNETIVHVDFADQPCVAVVDGTKTLQAGENITMYFDPNSLFMFDIGGQTVASPASSV
jgi:glycerol transport system ATP-binding protein